MKKLHELKIKIKIHEETNLDNYNWLVNTEYKTKSFKDLDELKAYILKCSAYNNNSTDDFMIEYYIKCNKLNKYVLISDYMINNLNDYVK